MEENKEPKKRKHLSVKQRLRNLIIRIASEEDDGLTPDRVVRRIMSIISPLYTTVYSVSAMELEKFNLDDVRKDPGKFLKFFEHHVKEAKQVREKHDGVRKINDKKRVKELYFDPRNLINDEDDYAFDEDPDEVVLTEEERYTQTLANYRESLETTLRLLNEPQNLTNTELNDLLRRRDTLQSSIRQLETNHNIVSIPDPNEALSPEVIRHRVRRLFTGRGEGVSQPPQQGTSDGA